jgi:propionate CoA-transferase
MPKIVSAREAVRRIADNAIVAVNSSSGLNCPDAVLQAMGERFDTERAPRNLTMLHPIAAGDMFGIKGIGHIAKEGLIARTIAGSYPSGPSTSEPPDIWKMITSNVMAAYNVPSGIMFDMMRESAAKRPGVITKVGLDTFADPVNEGCAMNEKASAAPIVKKINFDGEEWLYFPVITPHVSIIRGSTCDRRGNMTFEQEGAYLGAM